MVARTQAALSREVFGRMYKIKAFGRDPRDGAGPHSHMSIMTHPG